MKLKQLIILTTLAVSTSSFAQDTGYYLGGKLGTSIMQSKDVRTDGYSYSNPTDFDYSVFGNKNKAVFNLGVKLGVNLYNHGTSWVRFPIRLELDYTYRAKAKMNTSVYDFSSIGGNAGGGSENTSFNIKNSTLMANAYWDFYNGSRFTPYIGLGLGTSFVKFDGGADSESISKTKFAWALMAGASYELSENVTAELEYRYLDSGKVKKNLSSDIWNDEFSAKLKSHDISIGIRYNF